MRTLLLGFLLLTPLISAAEYRAFVLEITSQDGTKKQILSTLDPDQYRGYHTVLDTETITYVDTWMCRGRTSHQPICPNPKTIEREPADDPNT